MRICIVLSTICHTYVADSVTERIDRASFDVASMLSNMYLMHSTYHLLVGSPALLHNLHTGGKYQSNLNDIDKSEQKSDTTAGDNTKGYDWKKQMDDQHTSDGMCNVFICVYFLNRQLTRMCVMMVPFNGEPMPYECLTIPCLCSRCFTCNRRSNGLAIAVCRSRADRTAVHKWCYNADWRDDVMKKPMGRIVGGIGSSGCRSKVYNRKCGIEEEEARRRREFCRRIYIEQIY